MTPFKKILVPVDLSANTTEVLRYAADLSRRCEAPLTLVHVYQPVAYPLPEGFVLYSAEQLANMLTEFQHLLAKAKTDAETAGATNVETRMLQGAAFAEIIQCATEGHFDLIVMGTHGRKGLRHALLGSVAEKVVRMAQCPVLTVRSTE